MIKKVGCLVHKTHKDKSTSYHTGSNRNWVNCSTPEFASPVNPAHEFISQSSSGDQISWLKVYYEP